jgi:hypothetical protein
MSAADTTVRTLQPASFEGIRHCARTGGGELVDASSHLLSMVHVDLAIAADS